MIRFIHAADIHLDSQLKGLEKYEGAPVREIRLATRRALENLVALAIEREVQFVLIAGDLYDDGCPDHNTALFFHRQIVKLRDAGIAIFAISGNHDAADKMKKSLRLPDNPDGSKIMLPHTKVGSVSLDDLGVAIHGRGFAARKVTENVVDSYPAKRDGMFNIGLLHTSLDGESEQEHARYAPCKLNDLIQKGYDYWALGHIHKHSIRNREPAIVFPGNIQGRHIRETGEKGAIIVTVRDDRQLELEFQPLDVMRWVECRVSAENVNAPDELLDLFAAELVKLVEQNEPVPLAVRVFVEGQSAAHEKFVSDTDYWTNQLRATALEAAPDRAWIEKVKFRTKAVRKLDESKFGDGPIAELLEYIDELRGDDDQLLQLSGELEDLRRKLPDDFKHGEDGLLLDDAEWLRETLSDIEPLLVEQLHAKESGA